MAGGRNLVERVARASAAAHDLDALAQAVFAAVAPSVPFSFACLATTDPSTGLITRAFKSRPLPVGDEEFAAAEYGGPDVNLFAEIARRPSPVGVLSVDLSGDVAGCRRFRDYMTPFFGFTDEIRIACRSRGTTWGLLGFYRGTDEPAFTAADGALLVCAAETVALALQRVLFQLADRRDEEPGGPAVLIVDGEDRVTDLTAAVEAHVADLGGWDHGCLPANVLAVVALARSHGEPATARVLALSGSWLALRAMPLDGGSGVRSVVVTVDVAPPTAISEMSLAARGVTSREQDVVRLVLRGASTRVIADALFLSPHTVQDHLKSVFAKLGVSSRRELIALLVLADSRAVAAARHETSPGQPAGRR